MIPKDTVLNYWFTIEPYVYVGITNQHALLYNTFDGKYIETEKNDVIELLYEVLQKENCGVTLLTGKRYKNKSINSFINELREKFMGDIIDIALSKGKPVQLLPLYNFPNKFNVYKTQSFSSDKNVLEYLSEISIHVDNTINLNKLIYFLKSLPGKLTFNIIGSDWNEDDYNMLLSFFDQQPSPKNIFCSYTDNLSKQPIYQNNFSYKISVDTPIDLQKWNRSMQIILNKGWSVEYIFNISSIYLQMLIFYKLSNLSTSII